MIQSVTQQTTLEDLNNKFVVTRGIGIDEIIHGPLYGVMEYKIGNSIYFIDGYIEHLGRKYLNGVPIENKKNGKRLTPELVCAFSDTKEEIIQFRDLHQEANEKARDQLKQLAQETEIRATQLINLINDPVGGSQH